MYEDGLDLHLDFIVKQPLLNVAIEFTEKLDSLTALLQTGQEMESYVLILTSVESPYQSHLLQT